MFYEFTQNNSGGSFDGDYYSIIIEAQDAEIANLIASRHGIYFNGCESGMDCDCCGDRWSPAAEYDAKPEPMHYSTPIAEAENNMWGLKYLVVYADGREEIYPK